MRSHCVILLFAFLGILLANQLNQVNAKPAHLSQEDQEFQYDDDLPQGKDAQYDVVMKALQEIQNDPTSLKLIRLCYYRCFRYNW
ncbi:hypothetical protein UPYG_G00328240 [Umbra pygmaea]|uniref:Uncharacterized protein n=1 Tax=Umbra pygmaea TaxID=75934 RepID=A0ABD0WQ57_UMBPY